MLKTTFHEASNDLLTCLQISSLLLIHIEHGARNKVLSDDSCNESSIFSKLSNLLQMLDKFNCLAPSALKEDRNVLSWLGVHLKNSFQGLKIIDNLHKYSKNDTVYSNHSISFVCHLYTEIYLPHSIHNFVSHIEMPERNSPSLHMIRLEDLENHNKDGGHWVVVDGKVYDRKECSGFAASLPDSEEKGETSLVSLRKSSTEDKSEDLKKSMC